MADTYFSLTHWLAKRPYAATFVAYPGDGTQPRTIDVAKLPQKRWRAAQAILEGIQAVKVEALDEKGNLLRFTELGDPEVLEEPSSAATAEVAKANNDGETLRLFAKLLAEAYQNGAKLQQAAMSDLVTALTKRTEELKREGPPGAAASPALDLPALMQMLPQLKGMLDMLGVAKPNGAPAPAPAPKSNGVA